MKKTVFGLGLTAAVFTALTAPPELRAESPAPNYEKIAQEAERNRELLQIWKDHVKTLTKERDAAFKELETLKAGRVGAPAGQFGVETQMIAPAAAGGPPASREIQMQLSALQNQFQQVKKELNATRSENERLKAASQQAPQASRDSSGQIENLEEEIQALKRENQRLQSEIRQSSQASGPVERDAEVFMRQARELQYENDTLKAQIEKMKVVEKELASTRGYFTPLVKELQSANDEYAANNRELSSRVARAEQEAGKAEQIRVEAMKEGQRFQKESERMQNEIQALKAESQRFQADAQAMRAEMEQASKQNEAYRAQLQQAAADRERLAAAEQQVNRLSSDLERVQRERAEAGETIAVKESEITRLASRLNGLEDSARMGQKYQTALKANLADMKNLKENFEAYLESLVASFEERAK